jgi:hypothetical protein
MINNDKKFLKSKTVKLLNANPVALLLSLLIFTSGVASAGPMGALKRGYIQNDQGKKCWYTQVIKENNLYFHSSLKGTNGIITFKNPMCMAASELGLDVNKMSINNIISRLYSHSDANFQTRPSEMFNGSLLQKKGKCIQSKKYHIIGITVDYFVANNSITSVIHGSSVQGCQNQNLTNKIF